jgi:uncharacterized membrane protein YbhN (UPF0104 family)
VVAAPGGDLLKRILVRLAQLAATILVTWFVSTRAGLHLAELAELDLADWSPRWGVLALSCAILLGGYFGTGLLWGWITAGLGGPTLPPGVSIRLFMIANLGRYVPGKVWQIAGLVALARQYGVPAGTATAAAIVAQGVSLASATLIGLGAVWTLADGAPWRWAVPVALFGGVGLGLVPTVFDLLANAWFRLARAPRPEGLAPRHGIGWLAGGLAGWLVYAAAFWVLVAGLGFDVPFLATASAFAAAYVLGYLMIFAPAGIGVREGFLIALLSPQLGAVSAGAIAVIARLWTTLVEVVPAATFWARHLASTGRAGEARDG